MESVGPASPLTCAARIPVFGRAPGPCSKLVECLIPPARQLGLTRRGDLLKAGAYATPTWSTGQRVAKILISIIWMTGRDVLVGLPGMWSQLLGLGSAPETIWPAVISIAASSRPPFHGKHWRLAPEGRPYASLPFTVRDRITRPERLLTVLTCPSRRYEHIGPIVGYSNRAAARHRPGSNYLGNFL